MSRLVRYLTCIVSILSFIIYTNCSSDKKNPAEPSTEPNPEKIYYYASRDLGISSSKLTCLAVDHDGKLIIGTDGWDGTIRFDGKNTETIWETAYTIAVDEDNRIWCGYDMIHVGVAVVGRSDTTMYSLEDVAKYHQHIFKIHIDDLNNVWLGSSIIIRYNGEWHSFLNEEHAPNNFVMDITSDQNGNLWVIAGSTLYKYDGAKWTLYNSLYYDIPENVFSSIAVDHQGNVWFGSFYFEVDEKFFLAKFDGTNFTIFNRYNSLLEGHQILALAVDLNGDLLIGTDYLIYKYDGTDFEKLDIGLYGGMEDMIVDENGNLWVAYKTGLGVYRKGGVVFP